MEGPFPMLFIPLLLCGIHAAMCLNSMQANIDEDSNPITPQPKSPFCYACLFVMQKVEFYIQENRTMELINQTLFGLCDLLQGDIKKRCMAAIPEIESELQSGFDPQTVCIKLYLCETAVEHSPVLHYKDEKTISKRNGELSPEEKEGLMSLVFSKKFDKLGIKSDAACGLCKVLVGAIDEKLFKQEDALLAYIKTLCHDLPEPTDTTCLNSMDADFPKLWKDIFQHIVDPADICQLLTLCKPLNVTTNLS